MSITEIVQGHFPGKDQENLKKRISELDKSNPDLLTHHQPSLQITDPILPGASTYWTAEKVKTLASEYNSNKAFEIIRGSHFPEVSEYKLRHRVSMLANGNPGSVKRGQHI